MPGDGEYLIGLLLRFGVPLGMTAVVAWLLRGLDERWRAEGPPCEPVGGVHQDRSARACWEVRACPPWVRSKCPAYQCPAEPCWEVRQRVEGSLPNACLRCGIYEAAALEGVDPPRSSGGIQGTGVFSGRDFQDLQGR